MQFSVNRFAHKLSLLFLTLLFGAACIPGNAQYKSPAGSLNIGLASHHGLSFLEGAQFHNIKPGYSQQTGLSIKYYQTITISLQLDLLYSSSNGKYTKMERLSSLNLIQVDVKQKLSYFTIPLAMNFYLSDRFESENVHIKLGVVPSFLVGAKKSSNNPEEPAGEFKNSSDFKAMDFGFLAGIGLELRRLNLIAEYYLGVANLNSDPNGAKITHHGPRIGLNYFIKRWD